MCCSEPPSCHHAREKSVEEKSLTVLMCPQCFGRAAGAVSGCCEAQHRGVILGELLQTCHVSHMDTVLEVRSYCYHGNFIVSAKFPGQQLKRRGGKKGEEITRTVGNKAANPFFFPSAIILTKLTVVSLSGSPKLLWGDIWRHSSPKYIYKNALKSFWLGESDWVAPPMQAQERHDSIPSLHTI